MVIPCRPIIIPACALRKFWLRRAIIASSGIARHTTTWSREKRSRGGWKDNVAGTTLGGCPDPIVQAGLIMRKIPFYKMQGSGNDFLLIDNRRGILKGNRLQELARSVCHRHYSVGADGLIVIVPSKKADFKWRFFNADGSEAEMCGNGSRCAARFAYLKKIANKSLSFETRAGIIHAAVRQKMVKVQLPGASGLRMNIAVPLDSG